MNFLSQRAGFLVVGAIMLSIIAFLFSDGFRISSPFLRDSGNNIAEINGEKISYDVYKQKLDRSLEQFKAQYQQNNLPAQTVNFVSEQTWGQMVTQQVIANQVSKAGLEVGSEEEFDLETGRNVDPTVRQIFTDRKTGTFDPMQVKMFLKKIEEDPKSEQNKQWGELREQILLNRASQKYMGMLKGGVYVTQLDAQLSDAVPERINIRYIAMDYSRVPSNRISLTGADMEKYYHDHSYRFLNKEEERSFDYLVFNARPTVEDTASAKSDIQKMATEFGETRDDSLFVSGNSDTKTPVQYYKKGQLPPALDNFFFAGQPVARGSIYGPYFENGTYKLAKEVGVADRADSVRSRHILIAADQGGAGAEGLKKGDSIKQEILTGANFADLAKKISADRGSAEKGGELGFVGLHAMVPPFENAIFDGKKGDLLVVQSKFGTHIVEIEDQKNISRAVKIAFLDRSFGPSKKTSQDTYAKAVSFLSSVNAKDGAGFEENAVRSGFIKRTASDIKINDPQVANFENPRKLIQWAFTASTGNVSEVFELNNDYVIAKLTQIKKKGLSPLEEVKSQVQADALREKKGEYLSGQLADNSRNAASIDAISVKIGSNVIEADSLLFASPQVGKTLSEPSLVGAAFAVAKGRIGKPVKGNRGVYLFQVSDILGVDRKAAEMSLNTLTAAKKAQAEQAAVQALKENAGIKDYRSKFF